MSHKHRKTEHAQRQAAMKNALLDKERTRQDNELEGETPLPAALRHDLPPTLITLEEAEQHATALDQTENSRQELARAQTEARRLAVELEAENQARQNERKEKDALKKKLQEAEQEMDKHIKALEREKRENERQRLHYDGRIKELEQRAAASSPQLTNGEDFSANKATFRIDLYPHQGQFQGKIEHMLTHDKRAFSGVDHAAISAFIVSHLPALETKTEELQKLLTLQGHEERTPQPQAVAHDAAATLAAHLHAMEIVLSGTSTRTNLVRDDQPFDVELKLEFTEQQNPRHCDVALFAKRIEGGPRQNIGTTAHAIADASKFLPLHVKGLRLPRGTYRIEAVVNVQAASARANTLTAHKLMQVY